MKTHRILREMAILTLIVLWPSLCGAFDLVILFDITQSMPKRTVEENKKYVEEVLKVLPPGSSVTLICITSRSYSDPLMVLQREYIPDQKYILDTKPAEARKLIADKWCARAPCLNPTHPTTDILGAISLSELVFNDTSRNTEKFIIALSDMRHSSGPINIEKVNNIPSSFLDKLKAESLIPTLSGVKILVRTHTGGKDQRYMTSLRTFWGKFFEEAGASLIAFSPFCKIEDGLNIRKIDNNFIKTTHLTH